MPAMDGQVALERVSKWYGSQRHMALRQVSLAFEPGAVTALSGANGSGKTTLLRILAGTAVPSRGRVRHRPRAIGYAPERFPPGLRFTPAEYLGHMGRLSRLPPRVVAARTGELAARLGRLRPSRRSRLPAPGPLPLVASAVGRQPRSSNVLSMRFRATWR